MFNRETAKIAGFILTSCAIVVGSTYLATHKNMSGASYDEIAAYKAAHPCTTVTYSVRIDGESHAITLHHNSRSVTVSDTTQIASLVEQAEYLQQLETISFGKFVASASDLSALCTAFPDAELAFKEVSLLGKTYPADTTSLDLSAITSADVDDAAHVVQVLPELKTVNLNGADGKSQLTVAEAAQLQAAAPDAVFSYTTDLFGQEVSTDMETLEYFQVPIGDEGLKEIRLLLPMMHNLTYLKLDWCETSNEAMAQLRDDFPNIKVVWRVFFGQFNCLTDTYKIWATYTVSDKQAQVLKYCTEVKYLDLGHNQIHNIDFVRYMPDLEVAILAISKVESIEPLRNCKKLTYLEIFTSNVTDLSPLAELTNLEHLNISNLKINDISPLYGLNKLERMFSTLNNIPQDQIDTFRKLHPDCYSIFLQGGDPTDFKWRFLDKYPGGSVKCDRYALLTKQFGYDIWDFSRYPKGYVREEINSIN